MAAHDHSACSGCGLCQLVCPAWRTRRDVLFTPHGRAKAIQNGATAAELADSAASCTLCGACEPICPEQLPIIALTLQLRGGSAGDADHRTASECPDGHWFALRGLLGPDDLLVIAPRPYHADHARQVLRYDALRTATGCMTNLDLNRLAIPADDAAQAQWIVQGRHPKRIVVERERDRAVFAALGDWPVHHVNELLADRGAA